ncbi:MAG: glycosyltransferase [Candidatus Electrothrix sp. AR4]|nr:glycosyltransferase [Candidatus Electrothrix sp. AR4]
MVKLSVLMPVYNGEHYLRETMQSILRQTFTDFEFLVVDDGSTDNTPEIIGSFDDPRIRRIENPERLKLSGALNRGMKEATGQYIARMDADDIALPQRLQRQIEYMEQHPEVGLCGTAIEIFGKGKIRKDIYPTTSDAIRTYALVDSPFCHPTVMMRRELFIKHDLWYDGGYYPTEDYELWARATALFPTANLDEVLLRYRVHDNSMTCSDWDEMDRQAARIIQGLLKKLAIEFTEKELTLHRNIGRGRSCCCSMEEICKADIWLRKLFTCNEQKKHYEQRALSSLLSLVWYRLCLNNSSYGLRMLTKYTAGSQVKTDPMRWKRSAMLFLSIMKNTIFQTEVTGIHG